MVNLSTKFEVFIAAYYEDEKQFKLWKLWGFG